MQTYFTTSQLAEASGLTEATVRRHHREGLLKASDVKGCKGLRFCHRSAAAWFSPRFPNKKLTESAQA